MALTEQKIRLHTFHENIGISTPKTKQLYLTPEDAMALATELRRFAKGCKAGQTYATRIVASGKAFNESDGDKKPKLIA